MIRMVPSKSAGHAKSYFKDALSKTDYYTNDQELLGRYRGRLAARLGLGDSVTKESFFALADNKHPATGRPLTPRTKEERITGYDVNFHCPKSVSLIHGLSKDNHILDAFEKSVNDTMSEIESLAKTRIRKNGVHEDRTTGELVWAQFTHQSARATDGHLPDPHLHAHCFVFNATWDNDEQKYKAGKFRDIKRNMPYYQARFLKRFADELVRLGYRIEKNAHSFEVAGVPKEVIQHFSKRSNEIGRVAKEKNITNAKDLDTLGARTRAKKQKGLTMKELADDWRRQIKGIHVRVQADQKQDAPIRRDRKKEPAIYDAKLTHANCVNYAINHCFERASVVTEQKLLETAYHHCLGHDYLSLDAINDEFKKTDRLLHVKEGERTLCTTVEVLKEEKEMVQLARKGVNAIQPLYTVPPVLDASLGENQKDAITHVLTTSNRVSIIRGGAGTGKTTLTKSFVGLAERTGKTVTMVAPTSQASRGVLKEEGFKNADTVAKLLTDKAMQDKIKKQVLIVDEAGLLGTKDMLDLLQLTKDKDAQLILLGDTRQHSSVARGDALRILNTVAGIKAAEVVKIQRQKNVDYKEAVEHLSKGSIKEGFEKLDSIGFVKIIDVNNPNKKLVEDYVTAVKKGKSALIISPTHNQGEEVTQEVREALRRINKIGKKEVSLPKYTNMNFTEAEKTDITNYKPGLYIQFNQNRKHINRGSKWCVKDQKDGHVIIEDDKKNSLKMPRFEPGLYDVFEKSEIKLSKGDKVRITRNGFDKKKKRINNGMTYDVISFGIDNVVLRNKSSRVKATISKEFGHLAHAHCITSHAAQGKTVDEVFIAQPSATFDATNAKQFYVSVSRGRDAAHIYTDDKEALLEQASQAGDRQSAIEMLRRNKGYSALEHILTKQRQDYSLNKVPEIKKMYSQNKVTKDKEYEPGF